MRTASDKGLARRPQDSLLAIFNLQIRTQRLSFTLYTRNQTHRHIGSASCAVCERWVTHRPIPDVHSSDNPSPRPWTCTAMTYKPLELQNPLSFPNVTCILTTTPAGDSGRDVGERAGELRCCEDMMIAETKTGERQDESTRQNLMIAKTRMREGQLSAANL